MKKNNLFTIFVVIFFIIAIFINPNRYISSTINGTKLFFYNVFPTLFPFIFFTNILTNTNITNYIAKIFYKPINKIYHTSYYSSYLFVLSLFIGYPISSKILAKLSDENKIENSEILAISSFTSNSNPIFIIATVGTIFLKNISFAVIILVSHYLSSLFNGLIHSTFTQHKRQLTAVEYKPTKSNTMQDAVNSALVVLGYIAIFCLILDILIDYNILYYLAKPFNIIFTKCNFPDNYLYNVLIANIEVTRGILELTKLNLKPIYLLPIIASCISFGGICINLQCYNFLQGKIKFSSFIYTKITQALFAYVICFLICIIFKIY